MRYARRANITSAQVSIRDNFYKMEDILNEKKVSHEI